MYMYSSISAFVAAERNNNNSNIHKPLASSKGYSFPQE